MPTIFKPSQYEFKIAAELDRLWVQKTSVLVLNNGRDRFTLSDGNRGLSGPGFIILRVLKKLSDKAGYSALWNAFGKVQGIKHTSVKRVVISTHE